MPVMIITKTPDWCVSSPVSTPEATPRTLSGEASWPAVIPETSSSWIPTQPPSAWPKPPQSTPAVPNPPVSPPEESPSSSSYITSSKPATPSAAPQTWASITVPAATTAVSSEGWKTAPTPTLTNSHGWKAPHNKSSSLPPSLSTNNEGMIETDYAWLNNGGEKARTSVLAVVGAVSIAVAVLAL